MSKPALSARLRLAAAYVRQGAYFADVGTDHAYLPVFLIQEGRIARAVATDVREGPLAHAAATVEAAGLTEQVRLLLGDGAAPLAPLGVTDVALCGMGGELICRLLDEAPFLRDPRVRLILQPMSRAHKLRLYLASHGFCQEDESLCRVGDKFYTCISAHYTGTPYTERDAEVYLGRSILERGKAHPDFSAYLTYYIGRLSARLAGRRAVGNASPREERLLLNLEALL